MENNVKFDEVRDVGGLIYSVFLYFMLLANLYLMVENVFNIEFIPLGIHVLGLFYFTLRIYVFTKLKNKAHLAGHSLINYLKEKYGV